MDTVRAATSWLYSALNIPSTRQLLQLSLLLDSQIPEQHSPSSVSSQPNIKQSCPQPQLSCPKSLPAPLDTCCINNPAGHFLLAQFWDTSPPKGPNNSWTLHGLWPDYCTGGFPQFCDQNRQLGTAEIVSIVDNASKSTHPGLRDYMDEYWKGLHGDESLWDHEWNKHGTCVSTLDPKCYSSNDDDQASGPSHDDLLDYFTAATTLHSTLHTHDILASQGITPSISQTYSLSQIQSALSAVHEGYISTVKCNYHGELNEIWMHFTVLGSMRGFAPTPDATEIFHPVAPDGLISTCPEQGIKYLPKNAGSKPGRPHIPNPNPGQHPFLGRGFLNIHILEDGDEDMNIDANIDSALAHHEQTEGCLIKTGAWYTSGTCATYSAKPYITKPHRYPHALTPSLSHSTPNSVSSQEDNPHPFTLTTTAGPCAILAHDSRYGLRGEFVCANDLPEKSHFEAGRRSGGDGESDVLSWQGNTVFFAERRPGRFQKVRVFADAGEGERRVKVQIRWEGR